MCFKDKTFCWVDDCLTKDCHRNFNINGELHDEAVYWWGGDDYPLAMSDFSSTCDSYVTTSKELVND